MIVELEVSAHNDDEDDLSCFVGRGTAGLEVRRCPDFDPSNVKAKSLVRYDASSRRLLVQSSSVLLKNHGTFVVSDDDALVFDAGEKASVIVKCFDEDQVLEPGTSRAICDGEAVRVADDVVLRVVRRRMGSVPVWSDPALRDAPIVVVETEKPSSPDGVSLDHSTGTCTYCRKNISKFALHMQVAHLDKCQRRLDNKNKRAISSSISSSIPKRKKVPPPKVVGSSKSAAMTLKASEGRERTPRVLKAEVKRLNAEIEVRKNKISKLNAELFEMSQVVDDQTPVKVEEYEPPKLNIESVSPYPNAAEFEDPFVSLQFVKLEDKLKAAQSVSEVCDILRETTGQTLTSENVHDTCVKARLVALCCETFVKLKAPIEAVSLEFDRG